MTRGGAAVGLEICYWDRSKEEVLVREHKKNQRRDQETVFVAAA
jgi:hypothetical protein